MSVKVIAELNPASLRREELFVEAQSVADIIRELDSGFALSQARVSRNGEIVTDFSVQAEDGDTLWIKFVPSGDPQQSGRAMKAGGWALTAVGIAIGVVFGWTGVGAIAGAALIGTGLSMALGGQVLMNINIPTLRDRETPEHDPSIRGGRNQARPHGRVPVLFGRHRVYPDLAANPHTNITGNQQFFTQLFCGGYRDCVIDARSFKLGETPITELSATGDIQQILLGLDPLVWIEILQDGQESRLYPHCVHEDAVNAPLQHQIDGPDGARLPGHIIRTTPDNTDAISVDIFFFSGLGRYDNDGNLRSASVTVQALFKGAGEPDSAYAPLGFFNGEGNTLSGAELRTRRFEITRENLPPGQYTVKLERLTPDSSDSRIIDQVSAGSVRAIKSVRPIRFERQRELTIIALRVMATARLNGVIDSFNYIATSKIPVYSGGGSGPLRWLTADETRNPAAMLLYALRGRAAQQSVSPDDIDWQSFEAFYQWCQRHNYFCDAYLAQPLTIAELLRMIGATSRADILRIDSKISVVQDIKRPSPVQLYTPKNTISYSSAMFSADIPDAISLRFIDEDSGFTHNELSVYHTPDGNRPGEPGSTQRVDLWGVTGSVQARRIGMYNYACLTNRPFVHTIEVDIEYLIGNKGEWIQYAGDIALTGSAQGRVIQPLFAGSGVCIGIRVDEPVEMEEGSQYAARLQMPDGTVILKDVAAIRAPDEVYFTEPFDSGYAPAQGDIYAYGIRGREVLDLIITDIQPQPELRATLTCVEYSPAIFRVDEPDFVLPVFENRITPVSGAVDSGVVNPSQWRLFITHHDGEAEPPRPVGDGQSDGWHFARTLRSIWQSSKMAESLGSGAWGPPVRIKSERSDSDVIPVWLALSPQSVTLETDSEGNILEGLLPFSARASLFKWNRMLFSDTRYFPGSGGDLFDPALGDPFPTAFDIDFSLPDAPEGISVDSSGVITVAADAALDDENSITVQAVFEGERYTAVLFIARDRRSSAPRYLGTIEELPRTAEVFIINGPVRGRVRARQGDFALAVASGAVGAHVWRAGMVYQWTGLAWEPRAPERHADLYTRSFVDGLDVPGLAQDMGWFGAVFARLLVAQQAFIEELSAQVITLRGGGAIRSENYRPGEDGFSIDANGDTEFNNGIFRGELQALHVRITGEVDAGSNFLLKRDNTVALLFGPNNSGTLKSLTIMARGSCQVRFAFSTLGGSHFFGGRFRLTVNGSQVLEGAVTNGPFSTNVSMSQTINTIELWGSAGTLPIMHEGFRVDRFELWTQNDPGLLSAFG